MEISLETIITELIVNGGNARSKSIEAIRAAKEGNFELAEKSLEEANKALSSAHEFQTSLIQDEAAGVNKMELSLLMIHGQDHLMNAMTIKDLAVEMIEMYKTIYNK
jgi:cellobiose PTS system EIIA component